MSALTAAVAASSTCACVRRPSCHRATGLTPLLPSVLYKLYHEALMADILERHLWKEAHIQELCRQYVEVNPLDHRDVIQKVIRDVKATLDVR